MPSSCGMLKYRDFTSIVARVQFVGIGVLSIMDMR